MKKIVISGIYKITSPSGRIYIGSSQDLYVRENYYRWLMCKSQTKLYNSLKKYSWDSHTFEILEECEIKDLFPLERAWGLFYDVLGKNGLNCSLPGYGEIKGSISEETREKMSKSNKGRKQTEQAKEKLSNFNKNKIINQETRDKIAKTLTGIKRPIEVVNKMVQARAGYRRSLETQLKMNEIQYKKLIDCKTQIIYNSLKEAALVFNISSSYLCDMLKGRVKNKTNLTYYDDKK